MKKETLKLHLYLVEVHQYTYRVLMLRPSEGVRFSNNFYHETWHLLAGIGGADILAQLMWGMSFQKQPGTLLMIDAPHLTTTPFEANAPLPVIIAQTGLARLDEDHLRALRRKLSHTKTPTATVKWQTFSMDDGERFRVPSYHSEQELLWKQEKMSLRGGIICYTAPPHVLRMEALSVRRISQHLFYGSNHTYLAEGNRRREHPGGEVQVFSDFEDRVMAATLARAQEQIGPRQAIPDDQTLTRIWNQTERFTVARKTARKTARQAKHRDEVAALP